MSYSGVRSTARNAKAQAHDDALRNLCDAVERLTRDIESDISELKREIKKVEDLARRS